MKKIFTLVFLLMILVQFVNGQTTTSAIVNFQDLVAYEKAHPEVLKECETCPKKPTRWFDINIANMPIPASANIKKQEGVEHSTKISSNTSTNSVTNPTPMAPSRAPAQNFLGHTDPGNTIPPDTHGAVGINHVITATNDFIKIHAKVGGAQISQVTLSTFTATPSTCDPYMLFDPVSQRWLFSAIGCAGAGNPMILMVSNTADPTGTWRRITWVPTGPSMLLDHPYLGFDNQKIILSGRRFQGGTTFVGSSLFLVDKTDMLAGTPITFGANAQQIDKLTADGDAPCPVTIYEPPFSTIANPSPGTNYVLQSWNGSASAIRLTTVTGNIPTATWNTGTAVFPVGGTPWNSGSPGDAAEQMIETRKLSINDARISSAVMMNGKIWASHHIAFPTSGTPTRVDVQWWQLQGTPGGTFGDVLQRGRVGGNTGEYKWFPGIAVNKSEDVIIGYSASSSSTRVNAAYVTRQSNTPANTTDDELVYHAGEDRYWKNFGGTRARWGDYTHSALDPVDNSLWTIQQYASTGAGPIPPDNNSRSGVWWAQVPPSVLAGPVTVTATAATVGPTDYTTLKLAFDAINAGTHQGAITIAINANTDEGATPAVLNSTGTGAAVYTSVLIRPSVDVVSVVGTATPASRGVIELNGADNVTINGDNPNTPGINRNLTISTTSALDNALIWMKTPDATDGCTGNTIRNANLTGQGTYTTVAALMASRSSFFGLAALAANSNNTFQNNSVKSLQSGLSITGFASSPYDENWNISNNIIGSSILAEKLGHRGMKLTNTSGYTINNNTITGVNSSTTSGFTMSGIDIELNSFNGVISNNKISDIKQNHPDGWGSNGILLNAGTPASNTLVYNNFISDVASQGFASSNFNANGNGMVILNGSGYNVYYNTVHMNTNQVSATGQTSALLVGTGVLTADALNIRNNIFVNTQTVGTNRYSVFSSAANTAFAAIDYNDYYSAGPNLGNIGATNRVNLAAWQTGTGKDVNSKSVLPVFVSATDLHLTAANNCQLDAAATPIAGITTDIDNAVRNATMPDIGADEFTATGCGSCILTCPANVSVNNTPNQCGAIVNYPAPVGSIDCGTITATPASGSFFPIGTTTVNVSTTEGTSCSFTVTVVDNQPPVITCPANIVRSNAAGTCGAVVTFAATASDNCPIGSTTPRNLTQSASNTVTAGSVSCNTGNLHADNSYWRAYDLGPLALVGPLTINSVTFGIETANAAGVGTTQPITVRLHTSAGAFPGGARTLVRTQTYNVPDQTNSLFVANLTTPVTVPANAILVLEIFTPDGQVAGHSFFMGTNSGAETGPSYISAASCGLLTPATTASVGFPTARWVLNAAGTVPVPGSGTVSVPASGSVFPVGTTTVTSTATDGAGNMASCTFTVTVNDTELPTITCPAAVVRNTDPAACTATFAPVNPTAADNCAVTVQTWAITGATTANSPATGINTVGSRAFNIGVSTITYTVRDAAGNSRTCTQTITINDGQLPVINTQPINRTLCAGGTTTFSVAAVTAPTVGGSLTYQWQIWNGTAWVAVTGATGATTNTMTLSNVAHSMNTNSYRVQVIGLCTTVSSNFATLYVNPLPTITLTTSIPPALIPTQVLTITATPSSAGGSYVWSKNGVVIGGATSSILNNLTVNDIGTYSVVYTDANGCVVTSSNIVITALPSDKLYVFPVPNLGVFNVRFYNQANEQVTVRVFDAKGSEVYQRKVATILPYTTINVDMRTSRIVTRGTYVVEVRRADGSLVGNRKIIVN